MAIATNLFEELIRAINLQLILVPSRDHKYCSVLTRLRMSAIIARSV